MYVVLGADPQQRYNAKIKGALRDFVEKVRVCIWGTNMSCMSAAYWMVGVSKPASAPPPAAYLLPPCLPRRRCCRMQGKGVLLAGPPVVAGVDAAAVMLAAAAPVPVSAVVVGVRPRLYACQSSGRRHPCI